MYRRRSFPWWWIVLPILWCELAVAFTAVGLLSERIDFAWMRAGSIHQTFSHPPAPGVPAQERVETYWLFGHGFFARHSMVVTTLDFNAPSSPANGQALAWAVADEQLRRYFPTFSENSLGPQIKVSGWFPLQALVLVSLLVVIGWRAWRFIRAGCTNTTRPAPRGTGL